jgi:hypothetical protein
MMEVDYEDGDAMAGVALPILGFLFLAIDSLALTSIEPS